MLPPPGYPFEGPLKSSPPPPPHSDAAVVSPVSREKDEESVTPLGLAGFFLAFVALMTGTGFLIVALLITRARAAHDAAVETSGATEIAPARGVSRGVDDSTSGGETSTTVLPAVERNVPTHSVRFLEGCSDADLGQVESSIEEAVRVGVLLYNDGDFLGCYTAYEGHAHALENALPAACHGPVEALATARRTAAALSSPNARAWALRDAFDGLLEVIERSRASGIGRL